MIRTLIILRGSHLRPVRVLFFLLLSGLSKLLMNGRRRVSPTLTRSVIPPMMLRSSLTLITWFLKTSLSARPAILRKIQVRFGR